MLTQTAFRRAAKAVLLVSAAFIVVLVATVVAAALAPFIPDSWNWKAPKTFSVLGSLALAAGAFLQAWRDSADAPADDDTLNLYSWAIVCTGALAVLVGAVLA